MTQEVLKLALEFLEDNQDLIEVYERPEYLAMYKAVIDKCKAALAQPEQWGASAVGHPAYVAAQKRRTEELRSMLTQPEQEPVVCCQQYDTCLQPCTPRGEHLAQCTWVGLEGEEIRNLWEEATKPNRSTMTIVTSFARAIETKLKGLNT